MNYQETQDTWNKLAKVYEQQFMHLSIYNATYDYFLQALTPQNASVLEVGCGPANIAYYLFSKNKNLQFTLTDVAPTMLELAQKNIPSAKTLVLNANNVNTLNVFYDAIIAGFCIPYLNQTDTHNFFKNVFSLLNYNGIFYLSFVDGNYKKSGYLTGSTGLRSFFHYYDLTDLKNYLLQIGFLLNKEFIISYSKADNTSENHVVYILSKPQIG